ncbi:MAG: two-component regulator propeller domain-containing protein [Bacteroidia bacterium]
MQSRFLIFLLLAYVPLWAHEEPVYHLSHYSKDDGLIQSQVFALMQDNAGYLWMGTHGGACRFDGQTFQAYGLREGLPDNFLSEILQDNTGNIWFGTNTGLAKFDGFEFTQYAPKDGLPSDRIECLFEDQEGRIWVGTQGKGIALYENDKFQANPYTWEGGSERTVYSIAQGSDGKMYLGTDQGLFTIMGDSVRRSRNAQLPEKYIVYSLESQAETLWIGTNQGLFRARNAQLRHFALTQLPNRNVLSLLADHDGVLWLGTGQGIAFLEGDELHILQPDNPLLNASIISSLEDSEGNLWFGTDGGGVLKVNEGVFNLIDMQDGLSSNLAKSFVEDRQGRIWISSKDRGINVFRGQQLLRSYTEKDGLGGDGIVSSFKDSEGAFWFASYNGTLSCYDEARGFIVFDKEDGLVCNAVFCVAQASDGVIWVGTDNGVYWVENEKITRHILPEEGLINPVVYSMKKDKIDRMWIGTATGISVWEDGGFDFSYESDTLLGKTVITLAEDASGRMWAGSAIGLSCFAGYAPKWVKISGAPGAHTVVSLLLEKKRHLWVGTENGIYRLDLNNFTLGKKASFEHYTQKDGLSNLETNANASLVDNDGNVWFGTAGGAIYRPAGIEREETSRPPLIYITKVQSNVNENWVNTPGLFPAEKGPELDYTDNQLDFSFIGISLKSPQQVEYKYRLRGNDWSRPTRQNTVAITNLSPGTYTFEVTAKKEGESWDYENVASFNFTVNSPFYASWWFILLVSLAVLGIAYYIYSVYASRRAQQQEEQRIRNQADKLALEHQALYAMMNPHFTFNALQSIQFFIHRQDKRAANKFLSSFAKLVRKNLESTQSDTITLGEEIERLKLYLSLEKMRFPEKFDYEVVVEHGLDLSDTEIPPMLLQPFVENSIKHGIMSLESDGKISVIIESEGEAHLRVRIEDNGIGIVESKKRQANRPKDHVSKGMQITMDRLALFARMTGKEHSVDIDEIKSEKGEVEGTRVNMILPLKEYE